MKSPKKKPMEKSPRPKANPFRGEGKMAEGTGARFMRDVDSSAPTKSKRPKKNPMKK